MVYREVDNILKEFDNIENDYKRLIESVGVVTEGVTLTESHINIITEAELGLYNKLGNLLGGIKKKVKDKTDDLAKADKAVASKTSDLKKSLGCSEKDFLKKVNALDKMNVVVKDYKRLAPVKYVDKVTHKIYGDLKDIYIEPYNTIADITQHESLMKEKMNQKDYLDNIIKKIEDDYQKLNIDDLIHKAYILGEEDEHKLLKEDIVTAFDVINNYDSLAKTISTVLSNYITALNNQILGLEERKRNVAKQLDKYKDDKDSTEYIKFAIATKETLCKITRMEYNSITSLIGSMNHERNDYYRCSYNYIKFAQSALKYSDKKIENK